jgi:hypothetical protein
MDDQTVARMKVVCSGFQQFANEYLRERFVSFEPSIITLFEGEKVEAALHDVAANIFIIGQKQKKNGWINSSGEVYDLTSGNFKFNLNYVGDHYSSEIDLFDFNEGIIRASIGSSLLAAWDLKGSPLKINKDYHYHWEIERHLKSIIGSNWKNRLHYLFQSCYNDLEYPKNQSSHLLENKKIRPLAHVDFEREFVLAALNENQNIEQIVKLNLKGYSVIEKFDAFFGANQSIYSEEKGYLFYVSAPFIFIRDVKNNKDVLKIRSGGQRDQKLFYAEKSNLLFILSKKENPETITNKERLEIWDIDKGEKRTSFEMIDSIFNIERLLFLPGPNLILISENEKIRFYNLEGKLEKEISLNSKIDIDQITFDQMTNQIYVTQMDTWIFHIGFGDPSPRKCEITRIDLKPVLQSSQVK